MQAGIGSQHRHMHIYCGRLHKVTANRMLPSTYRLLHNRQFRFDVITRVISNFACQIDIWLGSVERGTRFK